LNVTLLVKLVVEKKLYLYVLERLIDPRLIRFAMPNANEMLKEKTKEKNKKEKTQKKKNKKTKKNIYICVCGCKW